MKYPLYIVSKEDQSIRIYKSSKDLVWMEEEDIEEELYSGWDSDGYLLSVVWSDKSGIKIDQTSDLPQPGEMRKAFFTYVEHASAVYRPDKPFIYDKNSENYEGIFDALKKHINDSPSNKRGMDLLRRF